MRLIDANQLKDVLALTSSTTEEYTKALKVALEQPIVAYNDPSELLVKDSSYPLDAIKTTSGTLSSSDTYNPALMALQCKSCGGVIDRDTMTCMHCGMTYMLVNSSEINPR
jgi:hypothetical protein